MSTTPPTETPRVGTWACFKWNTDFFLNVIFVSAETLLSLRFSLTFCASWPISVILTKDDLKGLSSEIDFKNVFVAVDASLGWLNNVIGLILSIPANQMPSLF
jgi:hypothetical protein